MPVIPSFTLTAALTPPTPIPGSALTATVTLHNTGTGAITGAVLTVTPPGGVISAVTPSQGTFAMSGPALIFTLGTIAAGATATATATVECVAPGAATVAASLASDQGTVGATATVTIAVKRPTASGLLRLGSRPHALPPGVYSLWKNVNGTDLSILPAGIVGIFYQVSWKDIETAEGVFDWSAVDAVIANAASRGLVVSLSLGMGGAGQVPDYVFGLPGLTTFSYINTSIFQATAGQLVAVPIPWDATALARKVNFIQQAGLRYVGEPAVRAVAVNACANGQANDWYFPNYQGDFTLPDTSVVTLDQVADWRAAGYTTDLAFGACRTLLDAAASWFPSRALEHPIANADPDLESSPNLDASACTLCDRLMAYGWGRWPGRFIPKWHRLKANTLAGNDPAVTGSFVDSSKYKYFLFAQNPRHFGWQFASQASAVDNSRQNGGVAADPLVVFNASVAAATAGYAPRVVEIWEQDATYAPYTAAIQQATDLLRTIHAGN